MTHPTQADGGDGKKGAPDGVNNAAGDGDTAAGSYPHPEHQDKGSGGFTGHGGQTDNAYHGPGGVNDEGENPNAATQ